MLVTKGLYDMHAQLTSVSYKHAKHSVCYVLSSFSRKKEITILSLQYRKAKELTVRLNSQRIGENAFYSKVLIP